MNYTDPSGHKYYTEKNVKKLRVCTDGRIVNKYEKNRCRKKPGPYGDRNHQCQTTCFQNKVASDEIPYIVVPTNMRSYKFSVGVVINRNTGDYLYCVVAELGPKKNGLGEVSIYAAWKMKKKRIPSKNKIPSSDVRIGNKSQNGDWKIVVYKKSAPNSKAIKSKYGWRYQKTSKFRKQIKQIGRRFYKEGRRGRCLN